MAMKIHIFIDESGAFDEGVLSPSGKPRPSVVGGVCSNLDAQAWATSHKQQVTLFNAKCPVQFAYPTHFHAGPLLAGRVRVAGPVRKDHLHAFYSAIRDSVFSKSDFAFASVNKGAHFEYSPQATYVLHLITALRAAFEKLAKSTEPVERCFITIAQRTIRETADVPPDDYMTALLKFVTEQLESGEGSGVTLARRLRKESALKLSSGVGSRDGGLIAADFVCSSVRQQEPMPASFLATSPDNQHIADYRQFYRSEISRLLDAQQYAAATDFSRRYLPDREGKPDLGLILGRLKKETDFRVLRRELLALSAWAEALIESRTRDSSALATALDLLASLDAAALRALAKPGEPLVQRHWQDIQAYVLMLLSCCHNHSGAVQPQQEIEARLDAVLSAGKPSGSRTYIEKQELLLQAKTRAVNRLFNNYQFEAVINAIQPALTERERIIPKGATDEMLGQMLGTLGQACAFAARTDPEMAFMARDYFEKSLEQFQPGTQYHAMSVNFLATLAWQEGNQDLACKEMARHPRLPNSLTLDTMLATFDTLLGGHVSPFDAVNLSRIAAASTVDRHPPKVASVLAAWKHWESKIVNAHPHEQLCKWLAFLALAHGEHDRALQMLDRALDISKELGFTVSTIRLSILGLQAITASAAGNDGLYARALNAFKASADELTAASNPFGAYISAFDGKDGLVETIKRRDVNSAWEIATFLPFNYA